MSETEHADAEQVDTEQIAAAPGPFERLASKGDEAVRRLAAELDRNVRMPEARSRLEQVERSVLDRLNIAAADEVEELRTKLAELEQRLLRIEEQVAPHDAAESI
ncbi:MAG: hypothetical protein U0R69_11970 [Gaiellales bacterium]